MEREAGSRGHPARLAARRREPRTRGGRSRPQVAAPCGPKGRRTRQGMAAPGAGKEAAGPGAGSGSASLPPPPAVSPRAPRFISRPGLPPPTPVRVFSPPVDYRSSRPSPPGIRPPPGDYPLPGRLSPAPRPAVPRGLSALPSGWFLPSWSLPAPSAAASLRGSRPFSSSVRPCPGTGETRGQRVGQSSRSAFASSGSVRALRAKGRGAGAVLLVAELRGEMGAPLGGGAAVGEMPVDGGEPIRSNAPWRRAWLGGGNPV